MRVIDIGARGGFEPHWYRYGRDVELIGLEPDGEECARLTVESANRPRLAREVYYPMAAHRKKGTAPLHLSQNGQASSMLETNWALVSRFPQSVPGAIVGSTTVETIDLDSLQRERAMGPVDFMKLDAEGVEDAILEGAKEMLATSLLGVSVEIFLQPYHTGRPLFPEIDGLLRRGGLVLFDFLDVERWCRKTLATDETATWYGRGQVMFVQALYLRDIVAGTDAGVSQPAFKLSRTRALKLASISEVFRQEDFGVEVLAAARGLGLIEDDEAKRLMRLLGSPPPPTPYYKGALRRAARAMVPKRLRPKLRAVYDALRS